MAQALGAALKDLATPQGRLAACRAVTDVVYGPWHGPGWRPKPYAENKGRYLWTDAFGVVNLISLACETGQGRYLDQAEALITDVHDTLGRDRAGRRRLGSATDAEPTRGGMRIGKAHPEEHHDGDGQYFHYLTKWAFALNRMSLARDDEKYNRWAIQLMEAAHPHFVFQRPGARPRMVWKISIDMQRPLAHSEGNLDPFDGLCTYSLLREGPGGQGALEGELADMRAMVAAKYESYTSTDPLDLGEALWLSHWALPDSDWALLVTERSSSALEDLWQGGYFRMAAHFRLAFREFGTTLGVQVNRMVGEAWQQRVQQVHCFWAGRLLERDSDITPVMFVASLLPGAWSKEYDIRGRLAAASPEL